MAFKVEGAHRLGDAVDVFGQGDGLRGMAATNGEARQQGVARGEVLDLEDRLLAANAPQVPQNSAICAFHGKDP
ncbi:MAG: hypothetical protein EBZ22_11380 [Flavobacteriia bacterium]|nr:hypothetical protein [Flavobacteriia bacterium]